METQPAHSFRSEISREEIALLPMGQYGGPVCVVRSDAQAAAAVRRLQRERVLGFDTETRAAFRKGESYPPALVQLAATRVVYLFQLHSLTGLGGLEAILSAPDIVKAGVSLAYDLRKLNEVRPFAPAGFVELQQMTDQLGIRNNGVRGLVAIVLGFRISKGAQRSNWALPRLSRAQIAYAATDAWACREIYLRLAPHAPA